MPFNGHGIVSSFGPIPPHTETAMDPSNIIVWAVCLGIGWMLFASFTGANEGLKSLFGKSKLRDLEQRVEKLEKRLDELGPK